MRMLVLTAAIVMASTGAVQAQDAQAGEAVFKRYCFPCHDAGPGAKVKLGPPLNGLNGRKAGTIPGFNYSDANKNSGIVWSTATFADYIKSPMQRMPGTRMAFAGVKNEKDIANLWAYLSHLDEKGAKK
ncbi:MAG: c-type cytochrome [Xanthobacteraceae bacterium]